MDLLPTLAEAVRAAIKASQLSERQVEDATQIPRTTLKRKLDKPQTFTIEELDSLARFVGFEYAEDLLVEARGRAA